MQNLLSDFSFCVQDFLEVDESCVFSFSSSSFSPGFFSQPSISSMIRARGKSVSPNMAAPPKYRLKLARRGERHDALPVFSRCAGFSYYSNQH